MILSHVNIKIQTCLSDLSVSSKDFEKLKSLKHSFKQHVSVLKPIGKYSVHSVYSIVVSKSNQSTRKSDKLDSFDHKNASIKNVSRA